MTIYTVDPPPSLGPIDDQTVGSGNTISRLPLLAASAVPGEVPSVTVSTDASLPGASYGVFREDDDWFFRFSPGAAAVTSGQFTFTVSATGVGGTTTASFTVTVTEGIVKTPPTVDAIDDQSVLARRTLTVPFTVREADGDAVTTNIVCRTTGVDGTSYGLDAEGAFFYKPTLADAQIGSVDFRVEATDGEGTGYADFSVEVVAGQAPQIGSIAPQTIAYGGTNILTFALTPTDGDAIVETNIAVKAGTETPVGDHTFSNLVFRFAPGAADIGKTFAFTASATDFDGTAEVDFTVAVILAKPVLKHCPVEDWTPTSFTADIEKAVPGATSYNLRYCHDEKDGASVTNTVSVTDFPYVASGLASTNYVYDVQAVRGAVTSAWSNAKAIGLHTYLAPTNAIPMTGTGRGTYCQNFDGLISSGSAYWYDARTIPGWYAAHSGGSMSDVKYFPTIGDTPSREGSRDDSGDGMILSGQVDEEDPGNRALAARARASGNDISFGVVFTNQCRYAVTNLLVSFTAMQLRRYIKSSALLFSYSRSTAGYTSFAATPGDAWTPVEALDFTSPTLGTSARLSPPSQEAKSADLPFEGESAIQPGEVIALRWFLDAVADRPTLGIDDLEVTWRCNWPRHTVLILH